MEEYNSKVKNLLLDIQANHGFRLQCCAISFNEVAVWTDLLKVPIWRSSTPLECQSYQIVNTTQDFQSQPHPNNSLLDRSSRSDRVAWEEMHRLEEVANQWNRRSQCYHAPQGRPAVHSTLQFSPTLHRVWNRYKRYNHQDRRYPNNRYSYRHEVSNGEGESKATMAIAKVLNKLTENFARMQSQPVMTISTEHHWLVWWHRQI